MKKQGYTFEGWYYNKPVFQEPDPTGQTPKPTMEQVPFDFENDIVTSDLTLIAKWTDNQHKVVFDTEGGTLDNGRMPRCQIVPDKGKVTNPDTI